MVLELITVLILVLSAFWQHHRVMVGKKVIEQWGYENNYSIISSIFKIINKGPFFGVSATITLIYKVSLKDLDGIYKDCWIRVGESFSGMLFNKHVYVLWIN